MPRSRVFTSMRRCALLALLVACSSTTPPAPVTNVAPTTRYALRPVQLAGNEGRHSSSHSTGTVRGDLELRGARATLRLESTWVTAPVHCAAEHMRHSRQACASPSARESTSTRTENFRGDARWSEGTLTLALTSPDRGVTLRCTQGFFGLSCALDGGAPTYVFATPTTKRFTLAHTSFPEGPTIAGALELAGDTAIVRLTTESGEHVERRGRLYQTAHGMVIEAGGPVGRVHLRCERPDARLACEITVDPEVFHRPSFWGPVVLVATEG